MKKEILN